MLKVSLFSVQCFIQANTHTHTHTHTAVLSALSCVCLVSSSFRADGRNGHEHGHGRAVALHVDGLRWQEPETPSEVSRAVCLSSFTRKKHFTLPSLTSPSLLSLRLLLLSSTFLQIRLVVKCPTRIVFVVFYVNSRSSLALWFDFKASYLWTNYFLWYETAADLCDGKCYRQRISSVSSCCFPLSRFGLSTVLS